MTTQPPTFDSITGDDLTVPPGQFAQASPRAVHGKTPCLRPSCLAQLGYGAPKHPHASGFKHAFRPSTPKPKGKSRLLALTQARQLKARSKGV